MNFNLGSSEAFELLESIKKGLEMGNYPQKTISRNYCRKHKYSAIPSFMIAKPCMM